MSRPVTLALFFLAVFLQAGTYGLTFMLPRLFASFGANEKTVGQMLFVTATATLITVYFAGHLSDLFGRLRTLALACVAIAMSLYLYGVTTSVGAPLILASLLLGAGWGLTYSLCPIVLTRLIEPQDRVRYFTLLSVFVMAGFGLSPVLAATLEAMGADLRDAFVLTAGLCGVSALLFFALRNAVAAHALAPGPEALARLSGHSLAAVMRSPARLPIVMVFLGASVFAGMNNFQTVFADARGLEYATFYLIYTITVVVLRLVLATFKGGTNPYLTIALLQFIMCSSVVLFVFSGGNLLLYALTAFLFGLGYGVSYPILVAMCAADADDALGPQTLQLFALSYFVGIFCFPLIAGWMIVEIGTTALLVLVALLAATEAALALRRSRQPRPA